ncbi:Uncharacterized protein HZ326_13527 [Fusarium oxysporum f. sp. albedinis]|nr:Uncharacterized protein HZ326_13527 [Fusarium oxysporum f. sp. albedinis]
METRFIVVLSMNDQKGARRRRSIPEPITSDPGPRPERGMPMTLILTKSESSLPAIKQVPCKDSGAIERNTKYST